MTDLPERLRETARIGANDWHGLGVPALLREAAEEVERLRRHQSEPDANLSGEAELRRLLRDAATAGDDFWFQRISGALANLTQSTPEPDAQPERNGVTPCPVPLPGACPECLAWPCSHVDAAVDALLAENDELRAEVERLREQLAEADACVVSYGTHLKPTSDEALYLCIARHQARQERDDD